MLSNNFYGSCCHFRFKLFSVPEYRCVAGKVKILCETGSSSSAPLQISRCYGGHDRKQKKNLLTRTKSAECVERRACLCSVQLARKPPSGRIVKPVGAYDSLHASQPADCIRKYRLVYRWVKGTDLVFWISLTFP